MGSAGFTNRFGTHAASAANDASCTPPLCRTAATPAVRKLWAMRMPCFSRRWSPIRSTGADTNGALKRNVGSTAAPRLDQVLGAQRRDGRTQRVSREPDAAVLPGRGRGCHGLVYGLHGGAEAGLALQPVAQQLEVQLQVPLRRALLGDGAAEGDDVVRGGGGGCGVEEVERRLERVDGAEDGAVGGVDEHLPQFELEEPPPLRRAGIGALTVPLPVSLQDVDALDKARHDGSTVVGAVPGRGKASDHIGDHSTPSHRTFSIIHNPHKIQASEHES
ncbi:hypothetical protein U9M48_017903 [Paspalum notatum var. saurae]|uniref:Uncharacterized protein n=1 Tax=Paspalum notatum var. saurae TaxID=547442 RepID=A0AAQ3T8T6_PASNO